jgi:hypothetical protein
MMNAQCMVHSVHLPEAHSSQAHLFMLALEFRGPFLVVAPKAVLSNWVKEADRWLPAACVTVLYDGPGEERKAMQRTYLKGTNFNLLLTHYHIAISDRPALSKIQVRLTVATCGEHVALLYSCVLFFVWFLLQKGVPVTRFIYVC